MSQSVTQQLVPRIQSTLPVWAKAVSFLLPLRRYEAYRFLQVDPITLRGYLPWYLLVNTLVVTLLIATTEMTPHGQTMPPQSLQDALSFLFRVYLLFFAYVLGMTLVRFRKQ